jgi:hypothetical protein
MMRCSKLLQLRQCEDNGRPNIHIATVFGEWWRHIKSKIVIAEPHTGLA